MNKRILILHAASSVLIMFCAFLLLVDALGGKAFLLRVKLTRLFAYTICLGYVFSGV